MTLHRIPDRKKEEYKGFFIVPVIGGFNIVMIGSNPEVFHSLYFSGNKGVDLSVHSTNAKLFRTVEFCKSVIDEIVGDHGDWVSSLKGRKVARAAVDSILY